MELHWSNILIVLGTGAVSLNCGGVTDSALQSTVATGGQSPANTSPSSGGSGNVNSNAQAGTATSGQNTGVDASIVTPSVDSGSPDAAANGGEADSGTDMPQIGDAIWFVSSVSLQVSRDTVITWPSHETLGGGCQKYARNDLTNDQLATLATYRLVAPDGQCTTADGYVEATVVVTDKDGSVKVYRYNSCPFYLAGASAVLPPTFDPYFYGAVGQPC
jgi:hypothetical protein